MGVGAGLYMCDVVEKSSRSLSHLLMSSCNRYRPIGLTARITWLNTVQRDLRAYNLTLNEAVDLAQNRPLWRLMSTYGATHS